MELKILGQHLRKIRSICVLGEDLPRIKGVLKPEGPQTWGPAFHYSSNPKVGFDHVNLPFGKGVIDGAGN